MLNPLKEGFCKLREGFDGQIIWLVASIAVPLHQQLQNEMFNLNPNQSLDRHQCL